MIKTTRGDILWNYGANLLNIAVSILVLPLILKMLSPTELGLWYVFISISALALLMDFGFSITFMRHISYAVSGATEILSIGVPNKELDSPNYPLIKAIINAAKRIYLSLTLLASTVILPLGYTYIIFILRITEPSLILAWTIYGIGSLVNLLTSFWNPILKGSGGIKSANKVVIFSKSSYLVLASIGLALGGGLVLLTSSYLLSVIINWFWSRYELNRYLGPVYKQSQTDPNYTDRSIHKLVWPNAKRMGLVSLGSWATNRASTLISSYFLGLEITGQLGVSIQLFTVVGNIANLLFNSYLPELASTRTNKDNRRFKKLFVRSITVQWILTVVGNLSVILILPFMLAFLNISTRLLPLPWLSILGLILFLEQNHSSFATLITLTNRVPFVKASLISGFSIILLSIIFMLLGFGVGALILIQGMVQLSYNNWYWPYLVIKENDIFISKN